MELSQLAVPFVYGLIFFLAFPSQWLMLHLDPQPLTSNEIITTNIFLVLILITYTQSVFVDPGTIPKDWQTLVSPENPASENDTRKEEAQPSSKSTHPPLPQPKKYCTKCSAPKPPRAHHCKSCHRCVPKMDHHCPWTANCVSYTTFPHFIRFLTYTTLGMSWLESLLFSRAYQLWENRDMPSYLGPSVLQLALLFVLLGANSITVFAIGILCVRNLWCMAVNTTTIEGWEIERHATLVRRARHFGGYLDAPDGTQVRIKRQEFPYDVGVWANLVQAMGSRNPLNWLNPFSKTPGILGGVKFETNGFEDENTVWPPPDPDRAYKRPSRAVNADAFTYQNAEMSNEDTVRAFRERQAEDVVRRRKPFVDRLEETQRRLSEGIEDVEDYEYGDEASDDESDRRRKYGDGENEGEEGWRNSEGERLKDFGVDEDAEFYDELDDDIPLAELIARRKAASQNVEWPAFS